VVQTTIEGRVVSIKRGKLPSARLVLDLYQVGRSSVLRDRGNRSRLPVQVRFHKSKDGTISMADARNVNLAGAFYLIAGDQVRGSIRYTENGWILESVERAAGLAPPKVAALKVELSTDKQTYLPGEDVRIQLSITNSGSAPAVFNFANGQRYDFAVNSGRREVWRWSRGRAFAQTASTVTLSPGETLNFREPWPGVDNINLPVEAGNFTVAGWITAAGQSEITRSTAEIEIQEQSRAETAIDDLVASPRSYLNKEITLEGVYRARLAERGQRLVQGGPPTSRNDWILKDDTGSIYVAGNGGVLFNPSDDLDRRVRVHGLVRMNPEGRLYIRAWEVDRLSGGR
jgi:hypothetical protein